MPTARHTRIIAAPADALWEVIRDPHHLPRWWPRVSRVENVQEGAFTEVMKTTRGKLVRADFNLIEADDTGRRLRWAQRLEDTPFDRLLKSAETEVRLVPGAEAREPQPGDGAALTEVTIEMRQALNGFVARLGSHLVRRAMAATIEEALDGLERISG